MKKRKKIILWIAVIVLVLCSITALSIKPAIDASGKDLFFYRMSGFSLFLREYEKISVNKILL